MKNNKDPDTIAIIDPVSRPENTIVELIGVEPLM
jgi:hypothetical protein